MKSIEMSEIMEKVSKELLKQEVDYILDKQNEIVEIRKQLDIALQGAVKQTYAKGDVVSFEDLVAVKEISSILSIKSEENERRVIKLSNSIFPDDIFICQDYFDVWVRIDENTVVNFGDLTFIEVKKLGELN